MKLSIKILAYIVFLLSFVICCLLFCVCSHPYSSGEEGDDGTFVINLGGSSRVAWPPTDPASISELRYVVNFSSNGSVVKSFTAERTTIIQGSIAIGTYDVTIQIFLIADNSLFSEGEAMTPSNPVKINSGPNSINIRA